MDRQLASTHKEGCVEAVSAFCIYWKQDRECTLSFHGPSIMVSAVAPSACK